MGVKKRYILVRGADWWIGPRAYYALLDRFKALEAQLVIRPSARVAVHEAKGHWRARIERLYAIVRHYDASYRLQIKKSHGPDATYKSYMKATRVRATPGHKPLEL